MNEYTVFLVDDEDEFRGRVMNSITSNSGFKVIGTAANGYDALELFENEIPDLLITDIKMPFIDGIELTKIVRKSYPTVKVVFISSYDEFDYAKVAIDLDVVSYITKPIDQDMLREFLQSFKLKLDQEAYELEKITTLKRNYSESKSLLIKNLYKTCLLSQVVSKSDLEKFKTHTNEDGKGYCLVSVKQEILEDYSVIRKLLNSSLDKFEFYDMTIINSLIYIIKLENEYEFKAIANYCYEALKRYQKLANNRVIFGISNFHHKLDDLITAHIESSSAVDSSNYADLGNIIHFNELEDKKVKSYSISPNDLKLIEHSMKTEKSENLNEIFSKIKEDLSITKENIDLRYISVCLSSLVINFTHGINVDLNEVDPSFLNQMNQFSDYHQMTKYYVNTVEKIRQKSAETKVSRSEKIIQNIVDYLNENYKNPLLNMDTLCDTFEISVSYLSMLFKKHLNTSFVKYLTKIRIEKAKELLLLSDMKIIEISKECGYNEVYYFSHTFKKTTSMSPKEYRNHEKQKTS